jgi:O-succinylbenzoate synthase
MPEEELADVSYPLLVIERSRISIDHEREHRGRTALTYTPEEIPDWNADALTLSKSPYVMDYPIPYLIEYQITAYCRKEQDHRMPIVSTLAQQDRLPARFGYLEVPQDGTIRSLFLEGGPEFSQTTDSNDKRILTASWVVQVATELNPVQVSTATGTPVSQVIVAVQDSLNY